jgi:hypothetical protein
VEIKGGRNLALFLWLEILGDREETTRMKIDALTKSLLAVIALALSLIAVHPFIAPQPVAAADPTSTTALYIEPGTTTLRSPGADRAVTGKVVVDLTNGDVWGFPTLTNAPYPLDATKNSPPVSRPIYLGKYDFAAIQAGTTK